MTAAARLFDAATGVAFQCKSFWAALATDAGLGEVEAQERLGRLHRLILLSPATRARLLEEDGHADDGRLLLAEERLRTGASAASLLQRALRELVGDRTQRAAWVLERDATLQCGSSRPRMPSCSRWRRTYVALRTHGSRPCARSTPTRAP